MSPLIVAVLALNSSALRTRCVRFTERCKSATLIFRFANAIRILAADSASARQNLRMPVEIRIDFKRSFPITVLRKKAPNIERGI